MKKYLIFTDLDGTLLNHDDYNFGSNDLLINKIISKSHKIIFNSSKTFKEILFYIVLLSLSQVSFANPATSDGQVCSMLNEVESPGSFFLDLASSAMTCLFILLASANCD